MEKICHTKTRGIRNFGKMLVQSLKFKIQINTQDKVQAGNSVIDELGYRMVEIAQKAIFIQLKR